MKCAWRKKRRGRPSDDENDGMLMKKLSGFFVFVFKVGLRWLKMVIRLSVVVFSFRFLGCVGDDGEERREDVGEIEIKNTESSAIE